MSDSTPTAADGKGSRPELDDLQPWQMNARATSQRDQAAAIEAEVAAEVEWRNENVAKPQGLEPITEADLQ